MGNEGGLAMTEKKQSVFETLSKVDVSNHIDVIPMNK